jgi:hypothetical protein
MILTSISYTVCISIAFLLSPEVCLLFIASYRTSVYGYGVHVITRFDFTVGVNMGCQTIPNKTQIQIRLDMPLNNWFSAIVTTTRSTVCSTQTRVSIKQRDV